MRSLLIAAALLLSSAALADSSEVPSRSARAVAEPLHLTVSQDRELDVKDVRKLALDEPNVASVTVDDDGQVRVTGLAAGRATLIVWHGRKGEGAVRSEFDIVVE